MPLLAHPHGHMLAYYLSFADLMFVVMALAVKETAKTVTTNGFLSIIVSTLSSPLQFLLHALAVICRSCLFEEAIGMAQIFAAGYVPNGQVTA